MAFPTFTGISQIMRGSMTYNAHGVAPSVATIEFPPQAVNTLQGTFSFVDPDTGTSVVFNNCLIDSVRSISSGTAEWVFQAQILDERWTWQNREIRGAYNVRQDNGDIFESTRRTPQQLAVLLLQAMGVANYDVSELPTGSFPECVWDYVNAPQELNSLCESLGCRVVRKLSGLVKICRIGNGAALPNLRNLNPEFALDPANKPNQLRLVCGPTEWQTRLKLRAIAEEWPGGLYRPLDNVSYRPPNGWERENPWKLIGVPIEPNPPEDKPTRRQLALRSVFRAYDIDPNQNVQFPGTAGVRVTDILPINDTLLETEFVGGVEQRKPAFVKGVHCVDARISFDNTEVNSDVNVEFSIDGERGIVLFQDPVFQSSNSNPMELLPAELYLTCSHQIIDFATRLPYRETFPQPVPNSLPGGGTKLLQKNEMNLQYRSGFDNRSELEQQAAYYLAAEQAAYQTATASALTTPGIIPIEPDGAIQQISWSCGSTEPTLTSASRNYEMEPYFPSYEDRQNTIAYQLQQREEMRRIRAEARQRGKGVRGR